MHKTMMAALVTAVTLSAGAAGAQPFGSQGVFSIAAERVFGLPYWESTDVEWDTGNNRNEEVNHTTFGLAWGWAHTPYTAPRFALDYFVIESLSLGGAFGYKTVSGENNGGGEWDENQFILAPRVGYAIPLGQVAGFWPRGGFTYFTQGGDGDELSELALTVEAMFWIAPAEGVAFLVGPTLDLGLTGGIESPGGREGDLHNTVIGLGVGLLGWM